MIAARRTGFHVSPCTIVWGFSWIIDEDGSGILLVLTCTSWELGTGTCSKQGHHMPPQDRTGLDQVFERRS